MGARDGKRGRTEGEEEQGWEGATEEMPCIPLSGQRKNHREKRVKRSRGNQGKCRESGGGGGGEGWDGFGKGITSTHVNTDRER